MADFSEKDYKIFELFHDRWALVTAGTLDCFNSCTVGWGSMGTLWTRNGNPGSMVTVYVHPTRYTHELLQKNDIFTVSFFPDKYRAALRYLGSHSGRDEDKISASGLTPIVMGDSVSYREAELTFLCKKLYQGAFDKAGLSEEITKHYQTNPKAYPPDETGDWMPHWMYVGDIIDVADYR